MTVDQAVELFVKAFLAMTAVSGPLLAAALVVGLVVGVLQAATQINEPGIAFVVKLLAVALTLAIVGPWTLRQLVEYSSRTISSIADVSR